MGAGAERGGGGVGKVGKEGRGADGGTIEEGTGGLNPGGVSSFWSRKRRSGTGMPPDGAGPPTGRMGVGGRGNDGEGLIGRGGLTGPCGEGGRGG